ncbi:MAG: hypothetical protein QXG91_00950 [Candidatus Aenigmatarchaeota archaeon]
MKGLALETIIKMVILNVLAIVVILTIITFFDDIKRFVSSFFKQEECKTEEIDVGQTTTTQMIARITACWDKTGERYNGDCNCFILEGDFSLVDKAALSTALEPPARIDVSMFDPSKKAVLIQFIDVGNTIVVKSLGG